VTQGDWIRALDCYSGNEPDRDPEGCGKETGRAFCVENLDSLHAGDRAAAGRDLSAGACGPGARAVSAPGAGKPDPARRAGDRLIADRTELTADKYFHPRPSAAGNGYDATSSGGTNLAQSNAKLAQRIQGDIDKLAQQNPGKPVPIDLVTMSASGLDPDITPDDAYYQAPRVARARGLSEEAVRSLIAAHTEERTLGVMGEPRVNVLELNLALDDLKK
jgi:K+-transporting ATPase KdpC subunit